MWLLFLFRLRITLFVLLFNYLYPVITVKNGLPHGKDMVRYIKINAHLYIIMNAAIVMRVFNYCLILSMDTVGTSKRISRNPVTDFSIAQSE